MNFKSRFIQISVAIAVIISTAGCHFFDGQDSGTNSPSTPSAPTGVAVTGKAADGYISGATVILDVNDDRICESTEPTATTDANGNFSFTAVQNSNGGQHMTCLSGGTDITTNLPIKGQLLAPPGASQITPLTSLVMAQINSSLPPPVAGTASPVAASTASTASAIIATNLGLSNVNLLTTDPVAAATTIPALTQTTAAVQTLLVQIQTTVGNATSYGQALTGLANAVTKLTAPAALTAANNTTNATLVSTAIVASAEANGISPTAAASIASTTTAAVLAQTQVVAATPAATLATALPTTTNISDLRVDGTAVTNKTVTISGPISYSSATVTVSGSIPTSTSGKITFTEVTSGHVPRVLILNVSNLSVTQNSDKSISVALTPSSVLLATGTDTKGVSYSATLGNIASSGIVSSTGSTMIVNYANALAALDGSGGFNSAGINIIKGTFNVEVSLTGIFGTSFQVVVQ